MDFNFSKIFDIRGAGADLPRKNIYIIMRHAKHQLEVLLSQMRSDYLEKII